MMRPQVFMGIHVRSLAKQIQSSFDKSLHCHEILVRLQIPKVLSAKHAVVVVVFMSSQVCVCDMPMVFNCRHLLCVQDR